LKKRKTSKLKISDFTLELVSTERISERKKSIARSFLPKRTFCRRHIPFDIILNQKNVIFTRNKIIKKK
jgi:hypothetical protein